MLDRVAVTKPVKLIQFLFAPAQMARASGT
jgi:hypothetical protein